jgi:hypothetical protein
VTLSERKKELHPVRSDCGCLATVLTDGVPSKRMTRSARYVACINISVYSRRSQSNRTYHDEIVLYDEGSLLSVHDESLDDLGGNDTLLRVEVGGRLINKVDIGRSTKGQNDSNTLQLTTREVKDLLVNEIVYPEWLVNVGLELWVEEGGSDLLEEELTDSSGELGVDGLRLHGNVELWHLLSIIWFLNTSQHLTESGLSSSVLSHHDNNLRVGELTTLDVQFELLKCLLHRWVLEASAPVYHELVSSFGDTELEGLLSETDVFCWDMAVEENIDTFTNRGRHSNDTVNCWLTVQDANEIGQVIEDGQIVLYDDNVVIWAEQGADGSGSGETLLDIEVRRWLVEHVAAHVRMDLGFNSFHDSLHICLLHTGNSNGESLQFSSRQLVDITVQDGLQLQNINHLLLVVQLRLVLEQDGNLLSGSTNRLWQFVDILRLYDGPKVVLDNLGEIVLQLRSSEVGQSLGAVRWVIVSSQIWLLLSGQDLEGCGLSDTVDSDQSENLTRSRCWQSMELEGVGRVSVSDLLLEIGWQVDDVDG